MWSRQTQRPLEGPAAGGGGATGCSFHRRSGGCKRDSLSEVPPGLHLLLGRIHCRQGGPRPYWQCCVTLGRFPDLSDLCPYLYNRGCPFRVWNGIASPTLPAPFPPAALIFCGNNHGGPLPCSHSQGSLSPIQIVAHSKDCRAPGNAPCVLPPGAEAAEPEEALPQVSQMPPQVTVPNGRLHPTPSDPPALGKHYVQAWASGPGTLGHCGWEKSTCRLCQQNEHRVF